MTKSKTHASKNIGTAWTTFPTSFGICGVAWTHEGIIAFCLPEASEKQMRTRLKNITCNSESLEALPSWIKQLIRKVKAHMAGDSQNFSDMPLNLNGTSEFQRSVYLAAQKIPSGNVITYADLAKAIGKPKAARAIGNALAKNPIPLIIPCHRIIASSGKLGGFSAPGGFKTKSALLHCEGVKICQHL
jgi:methylated-DNA-[protein]-cysteine S-methyltransferase